MVITIKDEKSRFGVRVAAIIYNNDMTKIFLERQENHYFYMFPGGRLEIHEDTESAIKRELKEELDINENVYLKFISESFVLFPDKKYHEIGFYFIVKIDEKKYNYYLNKEYNSKDDGESTFRWVKKEDIVNIKLMPNIMKDKLFKDYDFNKIEHIVYREYQ